jgi:hypothetical protein
MAERVSPETIGYVTDVCFGGGGGVVVGGTFGGGSDGVDGGGSVPVTGFLTVTKMSDV